jgi:hypothetical protein
LERHAGSRIAVYSRELVSRCGLYTLVGCDVVVERRDEGCCSQG